MIKERFGNVVVVLGGTLIGDRCARFHIMNAFISFSVFLGSSGFCLQKHLFSPSSTQCSRGQWVPFTLLIPQQDPRHRTWSPPINNSIRSRAASLSHSIQKSYRSPKEYSLCFKRYHISQVKTTFKLPKGEGKINPEKYGIKRRFSAEKSFPDNQDCLFSSGKSTFQFKNQFLKILLVL